MKSFSFLFLALLTINAFHPALNSKAIANESQKNCEDSLNGKAPATYIGEDGQLYISKKAYVYAGQPVDTKKFKAPKFVNAQKSPGDVGATITVKNFKHNNKFYNARIPVGSEAIDEVYTHTMPFPIVPGVMAGHVQARFVMKAGFEIELLDDDGNVIEEIKDMIVSYEAALPPGASYNFALGAVDANPLVGRLVSGQQKLSEGPEREFNQYKLPLTDQEKGQLLGYYVNDSIRIKMDYYYNTVVRNCTTTIFDGIDSLPRFKKLIAEGTLDPFLTTIGGDPVIGPAVNALLKRFNGEDGQEPVKHVQDMKNEYKGIFNDFGKPEAIVDERLAFAPGGQSPMALVVSTHGTEKLSPEEKAMVDAMAEDIVHDLPETMNMLLASAFSVADNLEKSPQMIQAITKVISDKLNERLNSLNGKLPAQGVGIQVLFTPYPTDERTTDLRSEGVRAQLPFDLERIDIVPENRETVLSKIQMGIDEVDSYATEELPAYLKTFSVFIHLKENESKVTTQILMGLMPGDGPLNVKDSQVDIDTFKVPTPEEHSPSVWKRLKQRLNIGNSKKDLKTNVNMLLTHDQVLQSESNPFAQIRFGAAPEVLEGGQLVMPRVANNRYLCWSGALPHTPQLLGQLGEAPLGVESWMSRTANRVLRGKQTTLSLTDLEMNLQEMNIKSTRIRVGVRTKSRFGLRIEVRCLDLKSVNEQFKNKANSMLSGDQASEMLKKFISKINPSNSIQLP